MWSLRGGDLRQTPHPYCPRLYGGPGWAWSTSAPLPPVSLSPPNPPHNTPSPPIAAPRLCPHDAGGAPLGWHPVAGPAEGVLRTVVYLRVAPARPPLTAPPSLPGLAGATVAAAARRLCACAALDLSRSLAWWLAGGPLHTAPSGTHPDGPVRAGSHNGMNCARRAGLEWPQLFSAADCKRRRRFAPARARARRGGGVYRRVHDGHVEVDEVYLAVLCRVGRDGPMGAAGDSAAARNWGA